MAEGDLLPARPGASRNPGCAHTYTYTKAEERARGGWLGHPSQDTYLTSLGTVLRNMRKKSHPPDAR